jgi:transcriptional regulatory protein AMDR
MNPSSPSNAPSTNDAEICSAAAGVIQSIFESFSERQSLNTLWSFSVTTLFTAMIQLSVEVRFSNPLLAIAAVRRYDSTLYSLRQLARYWPSAESILHFFEHSERLQRQNVHFDKQGHSPELLASPRSNRPSNEAYKGSSLSPSVIRGQISPNSAFSGPLQVDSQTEARTDRRQPAEEEVARDWRQLFPFTENVEGTGMQEDFLETWYQMYWQEPLDVGEALGG